MALLTPIPVGTPGARAESATAGVVNPTTLTPANPTGYAVGDTLLCFTACRSATPTVATPAGWTSILNITGTNGRLALFAKRAASTSEAAPSVVWSGMTTGTAGTPAEAQVAAFKNLDVPATVADVTGAVANGAASTATSAGGAAITTLAANDLVVSLTTRLDDAFTTFTAPAGFTNVAAASGTVSGSDMAIGWAYQVKAAAGAVTAPNFGLTGATSFASSGVMIALKALVSPPLATLTDDFTAGTLDAVKWPGSYGTYAIESGQVKITTLTANTNYSGLESAHHFDLTNSHLKAKITPPLRSGSHECFMEIYKEGDNTNRMNIFCSGADWVARSVINGTPTSQLITSDGTSDPYWRIREGTGDGAGGTPGTVYFDTSVDGNTWTNRYTRTTPAWVTDCFVNIAAGHWQVEAADSVAYVDNVNLVVPADETIIDNFNRADGRVEAGGPWVNSDPTAAIAGDLRVISNQLGYVSGGSAAYTTTAVEGDDCDVLIDCAARPATGLIAWHLLMTNPGIAASGYSVVFNLFGNVVSLVRYNSGTQTTLVNSLPFTVAAGDSLWFSKRGAALKFYRKPSGGSYSLILSHTDVAPLNPVSGVIGIDLSASTITRIDNLRGGPQVVAAPAVFAKRPLIKRQAVNRAAVM